jgi:hypothetical protein
VSRLARGAPLLTLVLAACVATPSPTSESTPTPTPPPSSSATPEPSSSATAPPTASPTPEPPLSLAPPPVSDARVVSVSVTSEVAPDGDGRITVAVTSRADSPIDELVLRWPTDLATTLFLAPFVPSEERIRDGGPPLVQPWTKWVIGPGEQGEPAGTTSLGWGPLLAGATLEIPIVVTRVAAGPIAFDLQVLARNDLLTIDGGGPAELRVEVP